METDGRRKGGGRTPPPPRCKPGRERGESGSRRGSRNRNGAAAAAVREKPAAEGREGVDDDKARGGLMK